MKRRMLALLLAIVMLIGMVPTSVFADAAAPESSSSVTEVEDSAVETEAPEEETEAPTEEETEAPTEEPTEPSEDEEETEAPAEETEAPAEEVVEEVDTYEAEAAEDITVSFTVSVKGVLGKTDDGKAAVELPVTVKDRNADGVLTYDEALVALHEKYCEGGYDYNNTNGSGLWKVVELWGEKAAAGSVLRTAFYQNGDAFTKELYHASAAVADGDELYAAVVENTSDRFTWFNKTEVTVDTDESFTLTLDGSGDNFYGSAYNGVKIGVWEDGKFVPLDGKTADSKNTVTLSFDKAGTYVVTASGTASGWDDDEYDEDYPITAPYCIVTVEEAEKPGPADDATVYFTMSADGVIATSSDGDAMADKPVTVKDLNGDGVLTVDEALKAAHNAYCPGGYESSLGTYGSGYVTKLWGVTNKGYLFYVDNVPLSKGVQDSSSKVEEGSHLYASILQDETHWADWYTYFDKTTATVEAYSDLTLKLSGFLGMGEGAPAASAVSGVSVGTWVDGKFKAIDGLTTGKDGTVTVSFEEAGTYVITANGTVHDKVKDYGATEAIDWDCPILAPYCIVTVTPAQIVTATVSYSGQAAGSFLATGVDVEIPSNLAERYGFVDQVDSKTAVSALDVLVQAHLDCFGEDIFTKEETRTYLDVSDTGLISTMFGVESSNLCYLVNGTAPATEMVNQYKVENGDDVLFAFFQDTTAWSDQYTYLADENGKALDGQALEADGKYTLTVMGRPAFGGKEAPVAQAKIYLVDTDNFTLKTKLGTTGSDGKCTITVPADWAGKTVCLTAMGTNTFMSLVKITVPKVTTVTVSLASWLFDSYWETLYPHENVTVSSNLAESYGYKDRIAPENGVSVLDVLVKAHQMVIGDDFTPEKAENYLTVNDGVVTNGLGYNDEEYFRILINEKAADGRVDETEVKSGDSVFFAYLNDEPENVRVAYLTTADGKDLDGQSFSVDGYSQLVLMGTPLDGGDAEPISDGFVNIIDLTTGKETRFGEPDSDGILRIHWPESAANQTLYLAAYGDSVSLPTISKITVDTKNAPNYLETLQIAIGKDADSLTSVTFTPAFYPGAFDYTTPIQDYVADSSARYVWAKVTATDGTTVSCKTGPYYWDNTELKSGQWTKLLSLSTGRYNEVTLKLTRDGTQDNAYTVTIPMQPDTSKQTLTWKTDLKSLVYFRPNAEATLTVLAQHNNKPLDSKAEITYQWYYMESPDGEATLIDGATGPSFSPKTNEKGYSYFYVIASCDGVESIRSKTITVKITDEKAPTSVSLISDYPYYVDDTWVKALDGKKFVATKGDQIHIRAVDENGNDTPVEWDVNTYGSATFDPETGLYTVNYSGNGYITVTSLLDSSVKCGDKAVQTVDYKFSDYNRNKTVTLSADGQSAASASISAGVAGHNTWMLNIPEGVGVCTDDLSKKPQSVSISFYRPGTVTATVTLDLGGENDPKLTDTAVITVQGVAVECADGTRTRLDLEMTAEVPNPTASLTAYLMEGRTVASWASSNEDVATVDDKGVVTAKGIGSAIITATDSEGSKGGIKVVVTDAAKPTLESFAFSRGWGYGVNGLTFNPTTFDYTGLSLATATSKLEIAATTVYSDKLEAVATYTDEKGEAQTVAVPSGAATNLLPNIAFGTSKLTVTLSRKDNQDVKSVYTFEITRPRDSSSPLLKYQGGMSLLAADGSKLGTDLYKGKVEGFLFKADADGNYVGGNSAFSNNTYLYRAYMQNGRKDFTLSATANVAYSHLRYSTDNGQTWTELPQGGGRTETISFPEPTTGNAEVKVILQLVNDKVYADSGNAFPATVTHNQNGIVYTVWVEQIPSAEDLQMLTASTEIGYWYPAFDPDHSDYTVSIPNGAEAPELRYTVKAGLTVTLDGTKQVPDETGTYTLALSNKDRQTLTLSSAGGDVQRTYSFRSAQRRVNTADKILDHLAINSQYTNISYGVFPEAILEDTTSSLKSLGNFGGYVTFYFEDGLTNDPTNKYGVDFYIDGNAFVDTSTDTGLGSMEPGQVWVSEDGNTWYALAGSQHYTNAIWDYTVTYTRDGDGTHWSDNYGNTDLSSYGRSFQWPIASAYPLNSLVKNDTITLSGILIPSNKGIVGNDDFGTLSSGARFGYVDTLPNGRNNPYLENEDYTNASSGFDLAWAVDASGNPVDVDGKSFHYVKVVTASNIISGAANEKSTEVDGIYRAESTGSSVGTTDAPTAISFTSNGVTYTITPEAGKQVYEVALPMDSVSVTVSGDAENIYVNDQRVAAGTATKAIDLGTGTTLVRVIAQSGEEQPVIYLLKLTKGAASELTPKVTKQPVSASYLPGMDMGTLSVEAEAASEEQALTYQWFVNTENSYEGATALKDAVSPAYTLGKAAETGAKYYFCSVTAQVNGMGYAVSSDIAEIRVLTNAEYIQEHLDGTGTAADPFKIATAQDYQSVYDLVAAGYSFEGLYLAQTEDITLSEGWKPIGILIDESIGHINRGSNMAPFSGHLDGCGNTLTVPEGGLPLLGYVKDAYVEDLNIYGTQIEGYGLVNNLEGVGLSGNAITIEGVTLKSGTKTLKSGLIGTYTTNNPNAGCSGGYLVTIRDCVAEEGVVIGYDGTESKIGSFAGRINGTIENCVSYATVKGVDSVGGIVGNQDNSMTTFKIIGCEFHGTVEASGEEAGGILGSGYIGGWADNAMRPTIQNCTVTGTVTGSNKVGGIQGGYSIVKQTWANGMYHVNNNTFSGKATATAGQAVGALIGYLRGLDRYDDISGNIAYSKTLRPIGQVEYVDTNATEHETEVGLNYIYTEKYHRTDDILGKDAATMCTMNTGKADPKVASHLVGGKSTKLNALDIETGKSIPAASISWALADPDDAAYATVTSAGVVKAYLVASQHDVTFIGTLKKGYTGLVKQTITIHPLSTQVEILKGEELVNNKTLYMSMDPEQTLTLTGKLYPADAMEGLTWKSSNTKILKVADGVVTYVAGKGTVTITATAKDGSKKAASVKIQVGNLTTNVTITEPASTILRSGKALTLKATTEPAKPTVAGVNFQLVNKADSAYVTLTAAGKVTAKNVYEPHEVQIKAISKDAAKVESEPITLTVLPKANESLILRLGDRYVTKTTLVRNVKDSLTLKAYTLDVTSEGYPESTADVTWKSSNAKIATVENGTVTCLKAGTVTITATSGKMTATVTIKVTGLVESLTITTAKGTAFTVSSGKALALKATAAPSNASNKAVTWAITDGSAYAKVSTSGVVTANKDLTSVKTITVTATAKDGSGKSDSVQITVLPMVQGLEIKRPGASENTTQMWDMAANAQLQLSAVTYPVAARKDVTWKSSNAKIASIDANGLVTCQKAGTVTITATAKDGSGKKASFKLVVVKLMKDLTVSDGAIAGGKALTLKPVISPADTTNRKLGWSVETNSYGIKIDANGKLTTKAVKEPVKVTVTVTSKDGTGLTGTCTVTVYPATTKVTVSTKDGSALPKTLTTDDTLALKATGTPDVSYNQFSWKSSNAKVATVDVDGVVTPKAPGSVTITATAKDGTGKSAACKFTVVQMMKELTLKDSIVVGGKALTMKATVSPANTTNKKLTWSVSENTAGIKIDANGKLTTKAVKEPVSITVTATAKDGSGTTASCQVTVYAATTKVTIGIPGGGSVPATMAYDELLVLKATSNEGAAPIYTWKTNNKLVTVKDGNVTADPKALGKTVTITATAADGSGKSASVKVKIVAPAAPEA